MPMNGSSTTPVKDFLESIAWPGSSVDDRYLVLPRIVLEHLPLPVQSDLVRLLALIHDLTCELPWPQSYQVEALRWKSLRGLDEVGLRELGVTAELDWNGDLVHRDENTGRVLSATEVAQSTSLSCPDQLYSNSGRELL